MSNEKNILKTIQNNLKDGVIYCEDALIIAEKENIDPKRIREIADKNKIKIRNCKLGCF